MKIIILITSLFAVISYSHQNEKLFKASHMYLNLTSEYIDECLKESDATRDMLETFEKFGEMISNEKFRCFLFCMAAKPGVCDENGVLKIENLASLMKITDQALLAKVDSKCGKPSQDDKCYAIQDMILCFVDIFVT